MNEGYEVDFLTVGEGEKGGDAIALRFGNLYGPRDEQTVVVIDGGYKSSGEELVAHIQKYYNTDIVDLVVSTHPDRDHSSGLSIVIDELNVRQIWMHKPWEHASNMAKAFVHGKVTDKSIRERLQKSLEDVRSIETLAKEKKIPINEPFAGLSAFNGKLSVIGPSLEFYEELLPEFRILPKAKSESGFTERLIQKGSDVIKTIAESWGYESLDDSGETSAENETSTILLLKVGGKNLLFTGDSGQRALACIGDDLRAVVFDFVQVPHHGSQRNVNPDILDDLLGEKQLVDTKIATSFASTPPDGSPKHPAKKVTNAFRRRGAPVVSTHDGIKRHKHNAPERADWHAVGPLPFYLEVEE
jgi:beta-lactamase superfamily II metal-dependent hydrolase